MKRMSGMREEVESWQSLRQRLHDALELAQIDDESLRSELESETEQIEKEIDQREF